MVTACGLGRRRAAVMPLPPVLPVTVSQRWRFSREGGSRHHRLNERFLLPEIVLADIDAPSIAVIPVLALLETVLPVTVTS